MASVTERRLQANGLTFNLAEAGSGPPVLLLHGEPTWSFLYRKMIPPLVEAGHRLAQERVRAVRSFRCLQVIRGFKIPLVDFLGVHEVQNVQRLRLLQGSGLEVVLGEHDELAAFVFVALDEVLPRHWFALRLAHAFVVHRRFVLRMEQPEPGTMVADCTV